MSTSVSLRRRPSPTLSRFVSEIRVWTRGEEGVPRKVERLPDGTAQLLFRVTEAAGGSFLGGDISVAGPRTRAHFKTAEPPPLCIGFEFKPGAAYPFFGVPMNELTDRIVLIDELWGFDGERLTEDALGASSAEAAIATIERALAARVRSPSVFEPAGAPAVLRAMRYVDDATLRGEVVRIDAVAQLLGVSARQLRRLFPAIAGVSPRSFARMRRFHRAVQHLETRGPLWAELVEVAGYYDQSHLVSEFRELAGLSPTKFSTRYLDAADVFRPCRGAVPRLSTRSAPHRPLEASRRHRVGPARLCAHRGGAASRTCDLTRLRGTL